MIRGLRPLPTTVAIFPSTKRGSGADTRIRTEDLLFTKQLLYR